MAAAAIAAGLLLAAVPLLENVLAPRAETDDPAASMAWIEQAGLSYVWSGVALMTAGPLLVVVALGVLRILGGAAASLAVWSATVFALLSAGGYIVTGALRQNARGTLSYIAAMNPDWAESAYLVVHIAGTQALYVVGALGLAGWFVVIGIVGFRRGIRGMLALTVFPAIFLLGQLVTGILPVVAADELGISWFVHIAVLVVVLPASLIAVGCLLLRPGFTARFEAGSASRG